MLGFLLIFDKIYHMFESLTSIRVRYAETDRMGYVYYGNYASYYEVGRVEALRQLGLSYRELEDSGIMLPVAELTSRYKKPAYYDDLISVKTIIPEMPAARLKFEYFLYNAEGLLLNEGATTLVFVNISTMKPCGAPKHFLELISPYFSK